MSQGENCALAIKRQQLEVAVSHGLLEAALPLAEQLVAIEEKTSMMCRLASIYRRLAAKRSDPSLLDKALEVCDKALELEKREGYNHGIRVTKACVLADLGRDKESEELIRMLLDAHPNDEVVLTASSSCFRKIGPRRPGHSLYREAYRLKDQARQADDVARSNDLRHVGSSIERQIAELRREMVAAFGDFNRRLDDDI